MNYTLANEYYTLTVASCGAELISVKDNDGFEYIWQSHGDFWKNHAPLLFPVCGRLKNSKYSYGGKEYELTIHGFANKSEFSLVSSDSSSLTLVLKSNEDTKKLYPFDFTFTVCYKLIGKEITLTAEVSNDGEGEMPYMFGWHPGFVLPCKEGLDIEDYRLYFGKYDKLLRHSRQSNNFINPTPSEYPLKDGAYYISEDEIYKNDTMIFVGHGNCVKLLSDKTDYSVDMKWSENLPYLCVWKQAFHEAKFICLEPWSSIPGDGSDEIFETRKMLRLKGGEKETFSYSVKLTK